MFGELFMGPLHVARLDRVLFVCQLLLYYKLKKGAYDNGTAAAETEASTLASVDRERRLRIL